MNDAVIVLDGNISITNKEEFDLFIDNLEERLPITLDIEVLISLAISVDLSLKLPI